MGLSLSTLGSIVGTALGGPVGAALGGMLGAAADGSGARGMLAGGLGGYALGAGVQGLGFGPGAAATSATMPASAVTSAAIPVPGPHAMVPPSMPQGPPSVLSAPSPSVGGTGIAALSPQNIGPPRGAVYAAQQATPASVPVPGFNPKITDVKGPAPFLGGGNTTQPAQAQNLVPSTEDKPFWESPWMKYGLGGLMLAGMFEEPEYDDIHSPEPRPSIVDQYYADVAEFGADNVPIPPQLRATPASRRHDFGSRRSAVRRV